MALALDVEREEHTDLGASGRSRPKFLHVVVPAALDRVDERTSQCRSPLAKDPDRRQQCLGVGLIETISPLLTVGVKLDRLSKGRSADPAPVTWIAVSHATSASTWRPARSSRSSSSSVADQLAAQYRVDDVRPSAEIR
jgi:hypothetical protein